MNNAMKARLHGYVLLLEEGGVDTAQAAEIWLEVASLKPLIDKIVKDTEHKVTANTEVGATIQCTGGIVVHAQKDGSEKWDGPTILGKVVEQMDLGEEEAERVTATLTTAFSFTKSKPWLRKGLQLLGIDADKYVSAGDARSVLAEVK